MPEFYTLVEIELYQNATMPSSRSHRQVWLHAAADGEEGAITTACEYAAVADRDIPRRDIPFSSPQSRVLDIPECPDCKFAVASAR